MLDLETLSLHPTASIIAIGAVTFDDSGILDEFYLNVEASSLLTISSDTLDWWKQQSPEARAKLSDDKVSTKVALNAFASWYTPDTLLWGNGAGFDNVILRHAYHALDIKAPWVFWDDRCYRTYRYLKPDIQYTKPVIQHYALDDAKAQAIHLLKIREALK